jgi:carboxylate-amine ligase
MTALLVGLLVEGGVTSATHTHDLLAVSAAPAWEPRDPLTLEACVAAFDGATDFTIGVEEELMLVERAGLGLAPVVDRVLGNLPDDGRFSRELRAAQLEIITPVCASSVDACRELSDARRLLLGALDPDLAVLAAGTHPFSTAWGSITQADRYRQIADEYLWAATRSLVCGLHVHVAVKGAERALTVYNALRSYLPDISALAANAAFFEGVDTGMASIRPKLNEFFPRSGVPPAFHSWAELVRFVDWGRTGGLFPDASHFWWDLRLHPVHGTIEVRVADTQTRVEDASAVATVIHALTAWLAERYDGGEQLPCHDTFYISENAWRAHRHGLAGSLLDLETGEQQLTRERLATLLEQLEPYGERFGATELFARARTLIAGNGAERQRYVHGHDGIEGLTRWLVAETEGSAVDG